MKGKMLLSLALVCALFSGALAQEFPSGIWFNGYQSGLDSVSAMNFTWIQTYGGYDRTAFNSLILQNNRNLKVVAILEKNIYNPSIAQRMEYQVEK